MNFTFSSFHFHPLSNIYSFTSHSPSLPNIVKAGERNVHFIFAPFHININHLFFMINIGRQCFSLGCCTCIKYTYQLFLSSSSFFHLAGQYLDMRVHPYKQRINLEHYLLFNVLVSWNRNGMRRKALYDELLCHHPWRKIFMRISLVFVLMLSEHYPLYIM